ncbi:SRPBCC family protein [Streptosporangium sp. CA-135522]|uniref:SRPBCC family protein n=1 Tax=Streptosporangium sp. CA-135522 TaxID=3240072 RepID=UPI003D8CAEC3
MPHDYELHMEVTLDATPEQVWEAIATGPGVDSWFMGRSQIEPREGGSVRTLLGGFVQESEVTAWEPNKRFGYRSGAGDDGSFLALEWLIEGRDGGSTVLRSVGSGFIGSDDWEGEYDSLKQGGAFYFHNLIQYLTHFAGRTATPISTAHPRAGDAEHVMAVLRGGLGLAGEVKDGDPVRLAPGGLAPVDGVMDSPVDGVVDYATPQFLGVRTSDGLYRFFHSRGGAAVVELHLFSDVDAREVEGSWQSWLTHSFA